MRPLIRHFWLLALLASQSSERVAAGSQLTFEQHVEAQLAIAQVYYRHQTGATLPFDEAVSRGQLEAKVRAYLEATTTVTTARLAAEAERVARNGRMPERLREISVALGNDPALYLETYIRPLLAAPRRNAAAGATAVTCDPAGVWDNGILDDPPMPRAHHSAVWTGTEMIVWGGSTWAGQNGERYDPVTDTWSLMSAINAPSSRTGHSAIWTGSRMIIWGGANPYGQVQNTGGIYDPAADSWTATTEVNAPSYRQLHTAVWTGSEMLIWGGNNFEITGGLYDPVTGIWRSTTITGAPSARTAHAAVWTGSRMVVWGGSNFGLLVNTGGLYDPAADSWTATTEVNAPQARRSASAVWSGSEMVIWGGQDSTGLLETGGRYNPGTNSWTEVSAAGAPAARARPTAVWTGAEMILWGGYDTSVGQAQQTGGRYSPSSDSWTATAVSEAPDPRQHHTAVWTGSTMIVFGGSAGASGGRYDPGTDSWLPTKRGGVGAGAGVWTGNEVLIWDGQAGSRYSPVSDSWSAISGADSPSQRTDHVAVWSGTEMIVWGGYGPTGVPQDTGGRYNPLTDSWTRTSVAGAPSPRGLASAVWTGSEMIVWGGWNPFEAFDALGTGGRYNPVADSWAPTSMTGAPTPRLAHTAIWTGSEMIIWGGGDMVTQTDPYEQNEGEVNTGGRYDPATDTWTPTPLTGAPNIRKLHTAVWTGTEMVVFGGENYRYHAVIYRDGSRLNPSAGTWSPISTVGAPFQVGHGAVWTGSSMLVMGPDYYGGSKRYDPASDTWHAIAATGQPTWEPAWVFNVGSVALWTGEMMIVWSGHTSPGGRYVPASSSEDDDADGIRVCDGDCDDGNPAAWATPGEVPLLELQPSGPGSQTQLSWNSPSSPGGLAPAYDTIRSSQPALFSDLGVAECLESNDSSDTMALDGDVPLPGGILYYLVRAENSCPVGQGPAGNSSSGAPRSARACS